MEQYALRRFCSLPVKKSKKIIYRLTEKTTVRGFRIEKFIAIFYNAARTVIHKMYLCIKNTNPRADIFTAGKSTGSGKRQWKGEYWYEEKNESKPNSGIGADPVAGVPAGRYHDVCG
ncbi:MAG: hypothetical protein LIP10_08900 [Clostridiales bacterium]|nr:hypothetical protein [Clostridiales bacterium]